MSRSDIRRVLVAYDIPLDSRRVRLAKVLSSYGDRVQYSVFIVDAAPIRVARLRRELKAVMVDAEDSVLLCDLGLVETVSAERFSYLGRQRRITGFDSFIV